MLNTSGGSHWCTLCTLPTQHPSCLLHLTAVRLPLGVFEVIPSCSGTARWCCWSAAPWHGGWHPARAPRTRSPAGPTVAGEGFGPSGWWVGPRRLEGELPQSEGAEGSPVRTTYKHKWLYYSHAFFVTLSQLLSLSIMYLYRYIRSSFTTNFPFGNKLNYLSTVCRCQAFIYLSIYVYCYLCTWPSVYVIYFNTYECVI